MISFKAIIIPGNQRADGTYVVNIRITFKGKTRRLATNLVCRPNDLTRSLKIKNADILNKAEQLIQDMRIAVRDISPFDLENEDVAWVVERIKTHLARESFRLDFFAFADDFLQSKHPNTRKNYAGAVNAFAQFLGRRAIDINAINKKMLVDFMDFYDKQPKVIRRADFSVIVTDIVKDSTSRTTTIVAELAHIYKAAQDYYNDEDEDYIPIPRNPFARIKRRKITCQGQRSLGQEVMQLMISDQTEDPAIRMALDAFIVSFGLMGANMTDLWDARPFRGDWVYHRNKTKGRRKDKAEMRVAVPEQIRPYLDRLKAGNGGWWLNKLHAVAKNKDMCTRQVNIGLKKWAAQNGIEEFTFYACRHSWATIARGIGVEKALVDECLAHVGDYNLTDIYAERNWSLINGANKKVMGLFAW